jgi:hypothetical protein
MSADHLLHIANTSHLEYEAALIGVTRPYFYRQADPVTETRIPALYTVQAE